MSVHIIVCIKSVVRHAPDGSIKRTADNSELNPFDRPALEAAIRMREKHGGTVTALSMGPHISLDAMAEAAAMGVDRTILISDGALAGSDTLATSRVLAAGIHKLASFDLLIFGMRSSDSDTGQVGPQTATLLNLPFLGGVTQWEYDGQAWTFHRKMDDWEEQWRTVSPSAVTILPRAFPERAITLGGIGQALDHPTTDIWNLDDLGLAREKVGLEGSPTRVANQRRITHQHKCRLIPGEPKEQVDQLMTQLNTMGLITS
jgi:electron transfer flavoprotein beta subunit